MKWITPNTTEQEIIDMAREIKVLKRTIGSSVLPVLPYKRPFTFQETKVLKKLFGEEYKEWSNIDSQGRIILIDHDPSIKGSGLYFITEKDLKFECERDKINNE